MNQVLLVEGKNDIHVFANIFEKHKVSESFKIEGKDGDAIYKSIPIYIKTDISTIGIVIDADIDIKSKWSKLETILISSGYEFPNSPNPLGTIIPT